MPSLDVSVALPAYNEADTLPATVDATVTALESMALPNGFEVIIAEDGCSDGTPEVAADLAEGDDRVRHLHSPTRLGRGEALRRAVDTAQGEVFVYFDTDLATDLDHLDALIEAISTDEYDVVTGSRMLPDSTADRPLGRALPSRIYNGLVRGLLGSEIRDHQCGFKAFDRAVLSELIEDVEADHWFWDTEILVRAQRSGYRVHELPVQWEPQGDSTVSVPRDAIRMGSQLLGLWWRLRIRPTVWRLRGPIALVLTVALGYLVLTRVTDPQAVVDHMASMNPLLLAAAVAVYLLSWPIRGLRYRDILIGLGFRERAGFLTGAIFISQTGNLLVPARMGDAIRAYIINARRDVPYATGFASLAVERIFDLLTITLLAGGVGLGLLLTRGTSTFESIVADPAVGGGATALAVSLGVAVVAILGFLLLLASTHIDDRYLKRIRPDPSGKLGRAVDLMSRFLGEVRHVSTNPRSMSRIGVASLLIWSIDVLTAVLVIAAFGTGIDLGTLLVAGFLAISVGNLAKVVPLSPGGIGLYEAGFAILLVGLTPIGVDVAIAAAIVDHALKNLVTATGGVIATGALNVSLVTVMRESRDHQPSGEVPSRR